MKHLLLSISVALVSLVAPLPPSHAQSCWPYAATSYCHSEFYYPGVYTQDILSACHNQVEYLRQSNQELTAASKATVTELKRYDSRIRSLTRNLFGLDRRIARIRQRIRVLEIRRKHANVRSYYQYYIEEQLRYLDLAQLERDGVAEVLNNLRANRNDFIAQLNAAKRTASVQYQMARGVLKQCIDIVVDSVMR